MGELGHVLEGVEIVLILDETETLLKAADIAVQVGPPAIARRTK